MLFRSTVDGQTYNAGQTATIPNVGTLLINSDGTYTFTPVADYNGPVPQAVYTVTDGNLTDTGTLDITITPVNDAPVAVDDSAITPENTPVSGALIANDSDVDADNLSVTQFVVGGTTYTIPANGSATATIPNVGTLVIKSDGTYTFTPVQFYNGTVPAATYTLSDGQATDTAVLSITVSSVNDPPVASNDAASVSESGPTSGSLLTNDTDPENNPLSVASFSINGQTYQPGQTATIPNVGTLVIKSDGSWKIGRAHV